MLFVSKKIWDSVYVYVFFGSHLIPQYRKYPIAGKHPGRVMLFLQNLVKSPTPPSPMYVGGTWAECRRGGSTWLERVKDVGRSWDYYHPPCPQHDSFVSRVGLVLSDVG